MCPFFMATAFPPALATFLRLAGEQQARPRFVIVFMRTIFQRLESALFLVRSQEIPINRTSNRLLWNELIRYQPRLDHAIIQS